MMDANCSTSPPAIAILATGDEILQGDIFNSNSQTIAHLLFEQGFKPGMHMAVGDNIDAIETGIHYLLQHHAILIITGGLGPTSDDLTRLALSRAIQKPLILDESIRENIKQRLIKYGFTYLPKSNDQQALFPEGACIIPNPNGTAAGCYIAINDKHIFMLPGPPPECLPMVETFVLPCLRQHRFQQKRYYKKWLLFGVSEGHIAEVLENLVKDFECTTGYRITYPYVEFKIYSNHFKDFNQLVPLIEEKIKKHIIGDGQHIASDILKKILPDKSQKLFIKDYASGGSLESLLKTPLTNAYLNFEGNTASPTDINVILEGLEEYWQQMETPFTEFKLSISYHNETQVFTQKVPLRGPRVKLYAAEFTCRQILLNLN